MQHIADPLIDDNDEGMTAAQVRALFADLRRELVPMVRAITEQPVADDRCLPARSTSARSSISASPSSGGSATTRTRAARQDAPSVLHEVFRSGDVRITTRVRENDISDCLFTMLHEAGHALYEQGVNPAFEGTPLGSGTSMGVHESQSRLWENLVGRGRRFWRALLSAAAAALSAPARPRRAEAFYRAINKVERSLIRTEADEVTYNLHVMLRFDLELDLLEGRLAVKDLPEAWRARMQADLRPRAARRPRRLPAGRALVQRPHRRRLPVLHDRQHPERAVLCRRPAGASATSRRRSRKGEFATLHGWLQKTSMRHGRKFTPDELVVARLARP